MFFSLVMVRGSQYLISPWILSFLFGSAVRKCCSSSNGLIAPSIPSCLATLPDMATFQLLPESTTAVSGFPLMDTTSLQSRLLGSAQPSSRIW